MFLRPIRKRRGKPRRGRVIDRLYKAWIATLPCAVCGAWPVEVAHVGVRGLSQLCSDRETIPLCHTHHQDAKLGVHGQLGKSWWDHFGIDRDALLIALQHAYELLFPPKINGMETFTMGNLVRVRGTERKMTVSDNQEPDSTKVKTMWFDGDGKDLTTHELRRGEFDAAELELDTDQTTIPSR